MRQVRGEIVIVCVRAFFLASFRLVERTTKRKPIILGVQIHISTRTHAYAPWPKLRELSAMVMVLVGGSLSRNTYTL